MFFKRVNGKSQIIGLAMRKRVSRRRKWKMAGQIGKLLVMVLIAVTVGSSGCTKNIKPKRRVTVFVIDDFTTEESHGEVVVDIIKKHSFEKVKVVRQNMVSLLQKHKHYYFEHLRKNLKYVEDNPKEGVVINLSLGSYAYNEKERVLIKSLAEEGVIIVAAAGNDNTFRVQYPAAHEEVIAVAASIGGYKKADYSNYGTHIDISASGLGSKQLLKKETKHLTFYVEETRYFAIRTGTSFAAPRVSGLIAYMLRQRPELSPKEVVDLVKSNAKPTKQEGMGAGRLRLFKTLLSAEPFYQRVLTIHIVCWIAAMLFLGICEGRLGMEGIFFASLVLFLPPLALANVILIAKFGLIDGSIFSSVAIILLVPLLPLRRAYEVKQAARQAAREVEFFICPSCEYDTIVESGHAKSKPVCPRCGHVMRCTGGGKLSKQPDWVKAVVRSQKR
jgi:ribosomal protein S27E